MIIYHQFNMVDILLLWFSCFKSLGIFDLLLPKPETKTQSYEKRQYPSFLSYALVAFL